jgi:hypothetical protein
MDFARGIGFTLRYYVHRVLPTLHGATYRGWCLPFPRLKGKHVSNNLLLFFSVSIHIQHQLFIDFKKAYDSMRREVLYNIPIEFGIAIKLVRLIEMC